MCFRYELHVTHMWFTCAEREWAREQEQEKKKQVQKKKKQVQKKTNKAQKKTKKKKDVEKGKGGGDGTKANKEKAKRGGKMCHACCMKFTSD